jgi:4-amino-4-deoxy-L-arabinose transferase-like glycosyltransferase
MSIAQPGTSTSHWSALKLIACAAVLLMSAWIQSQVVAHTQVDTPIRADAANYVAYAYNLRHFGVFSHSPTWQYDATTGRPAPDKLTLPGYPAFLSLWLEGKPDMAFVQRVVTMQMLLGVATCALVLLLALRVLPFGWALGVAALTAISPHLATINTYLLTESLFTLLFVASLYALVFAVGSTSRWPYVAAGLVIGLASLVRPQLQLLPFVLVAVCVAKQSLRPRLPKVLLGFLCFLALLAPWQLRNTGVERAAGEPNLLVTTIYHGSFPSMMYRDDPNSYGIPYRFDPDSTANSRDLGAVFHHIGEEFREQPVRMLRWYLLGKPEFFLSWNIIAGAGDIFIYPVLASPYLQSPVFAGIRALSYWLHWPVTLLALTAMLVAAWRPALLSADGERRQAMRLLAIVFAVIIVMHLVGAPYPRYGIPFRPLVYLLGIAMLHGLWHGFGGAAQRHERIKSDA